LKQAMKWYREHGGSLEYVIDGKFINLTSSLGQHHVKPVERVKREKPPERVKLEQRVENTGRPVFLGQARKPKRIERVRQVEVFDDDDEGLDQFGMPIYAP